MGTDVLIESEIAPRRTRAVLRWRNIIVYHRFMVQQFLRFFCFVVVDAFAIFFKFNSLRTFIFLHTLSIRNSFFLFV